MNILRFKKDVLVGKRRFTVYSIGWFAFLIHRTPWTIHRWQRLGIIPEPILNLGNSTRWYLADEIAGYVKIYQQSDVRAGKKIQDTPFKRNAHIYEAELRKRIDRADDTLTMRLKNDEVIGKALLQRKEDRFAAEIENIMEGKNESSDTKEEKTRAKSRNSSRAGRHTRNR